MHFIYQNFNYIFYVGCIQESPKADKDNLLLSLATGFIFYGFGSKTYAANIGNLTKPLRRTPIYQAFHNFCKFRIPA